MKLISYDDVYALESKDSAFAPSVWQESRKAALAMAEEALQNPTKTLVLIDDNLYYRSMRHIFLKLAKKRTTLSLQINEIKIHFIERCTRRSHWILMCTRESQRRNRTGAKCTENWISLGARASPTSYARPFRTARGHDLCAFPP